MSSRILLSDEKFFYILSLLGVRFVSVRSMMRSFDRLLINEQIFSARVCVSISFAVYVLLVAFFVALIPLRVSAGALPTIVEADNSLSSVYEPFRDAWAVQLPLASVYAGTGDLQPFSAFIPQVCGDQARCASQASAQSQSVLGTCAEVHAFIVDGPWVNEHIQRRGWYENSTACPGYLQTLRESAATLAQATAVRFCEYEAPSTLVIYNVEGQLKRWAMAIDSGWELRVRLVRVVVGADGGGSNVISAHASAVVLRLGRPKQALATLKITNVCVHLGLETPPLAVLELTHETCVWTCRAGSLRTPWNDPPRMASVPRNISTTSHVCRLFPMPFAAAEFVLDFALHTPVSARPSQEFLDLLDTLAADIEAALLQDSSHPYRVALVALQIATTPHAADFRTMLQQAEERAVFKRELVDFEVDDVRFGPVAQYGGLIRVQGLLVTDVMREAASAVRERLQHALDKATIANSGRLRRLQVDTLTDVTMQGVYRILLLEPAEQQVEMWVCVSLVLIALLLSLALALLKN